MPPSAPRLRSGAGAAMLLLAPLAAAGPAGAQATRPDSAALVTVLGRDTIALERWVRTGNRIEAEAAVRSPSTSLRRYTLELSPSVTRLVQPLSAASTTSTRCGDPSGDAGSRTRSSKRRMPPEGASSSE